MTHTDSVVRTTLRRVKREALWQARKLQHRRQIALLGWHSRAEIGDDLLSICVRKLLVDEATRRWWEITSPWIGKTAS